MQDLAAHYAVKILFVWDKGIVTVIICYTILH